MRPLLLLYRPRLPSTRAQAIQVIHTAHALARRGHPVTLFADPGDGDALESFGLTPEPRLRLRLLPRRRTPASVAFRLGIARWLVENRARGVVIARSKRYADQLLRLAPGVPLFLEAHEVDSLLAEERGEDPTALRSLEARVLAKARGVVANGEGTLALLSRTHRLPPATVVENATHQVRVRHPRDRGRGVAYAGSLRANKDLATLLEAAPRFPEPLTVFCADPQVPSCPSVEVHGPVPHGELPDRLAGFRTLVLPLSDGLFGRYLTNPLKLWDYQAVGRPIVGADLPSVTGVVPGAVHPYRPGDPDDLVRAVREAHTDEPLRARLLACARLRSWDDRAAELSAFVETHG